MSASDGPPPPPPLPSLAIVLLHAEGDQFNAALINQREQGGKLAAKEVHRLLKSAMRENGEEGELLVHMAADSYRTTYPSLDAFLRGFASSSEPCLLAAPCDGEGGMVARIVQLLFLNLPLPSISRIFLGSLHTDYLADYLSSLPPSFASKITLLETVTVAPRLQQLIDSKQFTSSNVLQPLFGSGGDIEMGMEYLRIDSPAPSNEDSDNEEIAFGLGQIPTLLPSSIPSMQQQKRMLSETFSPRPPPPELPSGPPSSPQAPPSESEEEEDDRPQPSKRSGRRSGKKRGGKTTGAKVPAGLLPTPLPIPNGPFKPPRLKISKLPSQSPCNNYYLAPQGCRKHDCLFRHDFDFDLEAWKVFPLFVKSTICGEAAANGYCERGEQCIKGHRCPYTVGGCPYGDTCHYYQAGLPHSVRSS